MSYTVDLGTQQTSMCSAIVAVQLQLKAEANSLPTAHAISQPKRAKLMLGPTGTMQGLEYFFLDPIHLVAVDFSSV
jgi:hypothetical protein